MIKGYGSGIRERYLQSLFLIFFIAVIFPISCENTSSSNQETVILKIEGKVTDATNNNPISGGRVTLFEWHPTRGWKHLRNDSTDANGQYYIEYYAGLCKEIVFELWADHHNDYEPGDKAYPVCTNDLQRHNFQLNPRDE